MKPAPNILLLLAGGRGLRMHHETPKQFVELLGKPVFVHALLPFQLHDEIDEICVVCSPDWADFVKEKAAACGITKLRGVFPAGAESIDSLRNGIEGVRRLHPDDNPAVFTHEAVRPLITRALISENLAVFRENGNAITALASNEACLVSGDGISSAECRPRERYFFAQQPQTFSLSALEALFAEAQRQGVTRSQSLCTLHAEVFPDRPLFLAKGAASNVKITHPEDLQLAAAHLSLQKG